MTQAIRGLLLASFSGSDFSVMITNNKKDLVMLKLTAIRNKWRLSYW